MPNTSRYGITEIQRYLTQQMSPEEMYQFEKAMMDDPFLFDAVEGYRDIKTATHGQNIQTIENEILASSVIKQSSDHSKSFKLWWRAAAIFIVIIGLGVITYQMINQATDATIASRDVLNTTAPQDSAEAEADDTKASSQISQNVPDLSINSKKENSTLKDIAPSPNYNLKPKKAETIAKPKDLNSVETFDDNNTLIPPPLPTLARSSMKMERDSVIDGITSQHKLSVRPPNLSDTVAMNDKSKFEARSMPVGGWIKYNLYIDSAIAQYPNAKGVVVLEFRVNNDGFPSNIIVRESTNDRLKTYAIDILKKGAKWVPSKEQERITLTFNF